MASIRETRVRQHRPGVGRSEGQGFDCARIPFALRSGSNLAPVPGTFRGLSGLNLRNPPAGQRRSISIRNSRGSGSHPSEPGPTLVPPGTTLDLPWYHRPFLPRPKTGHSAQHACRSLPAELAALNLALLGPSTRAFRLRARSSTSTRGLLSPTIRSSRAQRFNSTAVYPPCRPRPRRLCWGLFGTGVADSLLTFRIVPLNPRCQDFVFRA
jgi:hypothetical protein